MHKNYKVSATIFDSLERLGYLMVLGHMWFFPILILYCLCKKTSSVQSNEPRENIREITEHLADIIYM